MYQLRGARVAPMKETEIANRAVNTCIALGLLDKRGLRKKRYDKAFEDLFKYGITVSPMDDRSWKNATYGLTIGHCDPNSLTITVPNHIYEMACKGERNALLVMFHEIGHLLLGHKALLHFSNTQPERSEDAEWQADYFAEVILEYLGFKTNQLTLDFY
ncbi:ImmA/IrrE family metallo-endopeptidase [Serratia fonticola]|uniref:ImmA/IrrE family metallo-endopeptidase n=1 Tax=Serratia fonticola TaxID=47917 RepID=A0AAE7JTH5_SERFO|nr:ImmA/IrrE family metallo-endopeptidase [Serratia fonticola]QKJ58807.1 ImmA/IrrE family metallo-endopeptidase [Serratia fonticola]